MKTILLSGFSCIECYFADIPSHQKPLDWFKRMRIALGAAKGLEYLHDKANPPVIYRDLKSSNILLDADFNAKLSDFGLAKLGPVGDKTHVSSRVMGTYGYCAPEYQRTGQLTVKSDVYSFGVVLLELITGRRVIDTTRTTREQNLVSWVNLNFPSHFLLLIHKVSPVFFFLQKFLFWVFNRQNQYLRIQTSTRN